MQENKKNSVKNILLTGSIVAGSVLGLSSLQANTVETFKYSELGSGGELRAELMHDQAMDIRVLDLSCGEKDKEGKTKDAKCGEKDAKATKKDSKAKDAKCGEHKATKDNKMKDAKCGEKDAKKEKKEKKEKDDDDGLNIY